MRLTPKILSGAEADAAFAAIDAQIMAMQRANPIAPSNGGMGSWGSLLGRSAPAGEVGAVQGVSATGAGQTTAAPVFRFREMSSTEYNLQLARLRETISQEARVVQRGPLDWSIVKQATGETRWEHVQLHGVNNTAKPLHGVFDGDPVITTFQAWQRGQLQGIRPVLENGVEVYNVPMGGRVGWQGGYNGTGAPLPNVKIVVRPGTTKVITAHPN